MPVAGNTIQLRAIRRAESLQALRLKTFQKILNVRCAASEKTSSRRLNPKRVFKFYLLFADGAPLHHRFFRAFPRVCAFLWKISAHIGRCLPIVPYLCTSTSRSGGITLDKFFIKTLLTSLSFCYVNSRKICLTKDNAT